MKMNSLRGCDLGRHCKTILKKPLGKVATMKPHATNCGGLSFGEIVTISHHGHDRVTLQLSFLSILGSFGPFF